MEIKGTYPNWKVDNPTQLTIIWQDYLQEFPVEVVRTALKMFARTDTKGFAPSIGQIINLIMEMTENKELTAAEAWVLVRKAISNGIYESQKEFDKLPELVKRAVGSPSTIYDWATTGDDAAMDVRFSHFKSMYESLIRDKRKMLAYPEEIRTLIANKEANRIEVYRKPIETLEVKKTTDDCVPLPESCKEKYNDLMRFLNGD